MLPLLQRRTGRHLSRLRPQRRPIFRLLPGGAGQGRCATSAEFFNLFTSEFTGAWFFVHGDGTTQSGSAQTFTPAASPPTSVTAAILPSGANGDSRTVRRYPASGSVYDQGSTAVPAGDFSIICLVNLLASNGTTQDLLTSLSGTATASFGGIRLGSTGVPAGWVFNAAGSTTNLAFGSGLAPRTWNLIVITYARTGGAGDNVLKVYVNGSASVTTASNAVLSNQSATTAWRIGTNNGGTFPFQGDVAFAGLTHKVLTAATVDAMCAATCGAPILGSLGEAVTFSRTGAMTIVDEATGLLVTAPSGRQVVSRGGIAGDAQVTQRIIRSEEFDNAAWTATNCTVTANSTIAPDGTLSADTLASTSAGGLIESTTAFTGSGGRATVSLYVRTTAGTQAGTMILRDTTAGADVVTVPFTATTTWQRVEGTTVAATGANNHKLQIYPGGIAGTGTIVAWGAQHEAVLAFATGYIRSEGATASRLAHLCAVSTAGWPVAAGEIRFRVRPRLGLTQTNHFFDARTGNSGVSCEFAATGVVTFRTGNGTSFTSTASSGLTFNAGQWYAFRCVWGGGNQLVYRDDVLILSVTNGSANMPDQLNSTCGIASPLSGTTPVIGELSDFEVFR